MRAIFLCLAIYAAFSVFVGDADAAVRVRKNIFDLSPAELAAFERGVAVMKSRPATDRTSWQFQANIHGAPGAAGNNDLWRSCEHGTSHFLPWHRAYLLEFESILREASGDPSLSLPYWDWMTQAALPAPLRNPASPLYDATRSINGNVRLDQDVILADAAQAMAQRIFARVLTGGTEGFTFLLEGSPHGFVHSQIGGNMGFVPTAARDPVFWLHHCNIDRMWEAWILTVDERSRIPTATPEMFLDRGFVLASSDGGIVRHRTIDLLDAEKLGYRYAGLRVGGAAAVAPAAVSLPGKEKPVNPGGDGDESDPVVVAASPRPAAAAVGGRRLGLDTEHVELSFVDQGERKLLALTQPEGDGRGQKTFLEINGLSAKAAPRFTYGAYLNLPDGKVDPEAKRLHRVGTLNLFGLGSDHGHAADGHARDEHAEVAPHRVALDASETIARLRRAGLWKEGRVRVTLEPITPVAGDPAAAADLDRLLKQSAAESQIRYDGVELKIIGKAK